MADKIVVMHDGLVEQIGTPLELYDNPHNLFVAGFIGSPAMNFLNGDVRHNGERSSKDRAARACRLAAAPAGSSTDGRRSMASGPSISSSRTTAPRPSHPGDRADRLGNPGGRQARRRGCHRGIPRAPPIQAGRQDPAQARSATRPSVRRDVTDNGSSPRSSHKGGSDHESIDAPHPAQRRHGAGGGRRAVRTGAAGMGQGLGASAHRGSPRRARSSPCCAGNISFKSEDDAFVKLIEAFTKATGVKVNISSESFEDVQPKASVAANTGPGPTCSGVCIRCRTCSRRSAWMSTDVADYLGKKYGGWVPSRRDLRQVPATSGSAFRSCYGGT